MFDLNLLKDDVIIITRFKKDVLKLINKLDCSVKVITKNELLENISFKYDDEAIVFLMSKGYSYSNAKEVLDNLHFIKEGNDKLSTLSLLKKELIENKLISGNPLYKYLFENKVVYIYGYSSLDLELKKLIEFINISPIYLNDIEHGKNNHQVKEFERIEEEVDYLFNEICLLVASGVQLSDIKLFEYPSEYELIIKKYASLYDIPVQFKEKFTLYGSSYFHRFLEIYQNSSLKEAYEYIASNIDDDKYHFLNNLRSIIFDINGLFSSKEKEYEYLINKAKNTYLSLPKYLNALEIVDKNYMLDKHIFIIGFNLLSYPFIKKDVFLLSDLERKYLGINTSLIENSIEEEYLTNFILSHQKLHISFKNKAGKIKYYPSLLIDKLHMEKTKGEINLVRGKLDPSKLIVGLSKDREYNYGVRDQFVSALNEIDIEYRNYNHQFVGFDEIKNTGNLTISYSNINNFNKCPFMYYVDKILGLSDFKSNFDLDLGDFFHKILERSQNEEFDLDKLYSECCKTFSKPEELFFAKKIANNVLALIDKNKEMIIENPSLKVVCEKRISILLDKYTTLLGYVDKIVFSEKHKVLMIVDYKTGIENFDYKKIQFGLSLQLPIYSILCDEYYQDYKQMGVFIQCVVPDKEDYRLNGILRNDIKKIKIFEKDFGIPMVRSKYFSSVGIDKEGNFYKSSSILDKKTWNDAINKSKKEVLKAVDKIRNCEFDISPIVIVDENHFSPCSRCMNRSICFKETSDQREVRKGE